MEQRTKERPMKSTFSCWRDMPHANEDGNDWTRDPVLFANAIGRRLRLLAAGPSGSCYFTASLSGRCRANGRGAELLPAHRTQTRFLPRSFLPSGSRLGCCAACHCGRPTCCHCLWMVLPVTSLQRPQRLDALPPHSPLRAICHPASRHLRLSRELLGKDGPRSGPLEAPSS